MHDIPIWFLVLGLFFPRWTLFLSWIFGGLPYHVFPWIGSFLGAIIFPRLLIAIYIFQNWGYCVWFWIYLIIQLFLLLGTANRVARKIND